MSKIARAVGTRADGPAAPVTYELPRDAVAEAIVNAVAHRDYASNASVQVMLFADRLEVWNPGQLPPPLTPELLRLPHASIPRNPLIAEPLFLTRYVEKAGTGILDMITQCKAAGVPTPQFRQDGGQFVQTLRRPKEGATAQIGGQVAGQVTGQVAGQVAVQVTPEMERLLRILEAEMTRGEIQKRLRLKARTNFEERYLKPALAAGLIEMTVPAKPKSRLQKYRLTRKGGSWVAGQKR